MLNEKIKEKVLKEKDLDKVLEILKPYKGDWGKEIMNHIQKITPDGLIPIDTFSYIRKNVSYVRNDKKL